MRSLFQDFSQFTRRISIRTVRSQRRRRPAFEKSLEVLESRWLLTNVLTYHDDIASTGLNATETQLTPANVAVNAFGKLHSTALDGQVYAQPLVDTAITIADGPNTRTGAAGLHDVVFVATQHDSLYAIDAASTGGGVLWQRSFLDTSVAEIGRAHV